MPDDACSAVRAHPGLLHCIALHCMCCDAAVLLQLVDVFGRHTGPILFAMVTSVTYNSEKLIAMYVSYPIFIFA